jgi:threonine dehydrogenase-like Zn-dependent dehydrogenase
MKAFVLSAPGVGAVIDVPAPVPVAGQAVIDVERVGVCGTDAEFFTGEMAYLHQGHAHYPIRLGHEWCGTVRAVADDVDPAWLGRRVMGDTMIGCGVCRRCRRGAQHVCEYRLEVGIRDGQDGALAEQIAVAASSLHVLPDDLDPTLGALVEPAGNSLRAARAAALTAGDRALVIGPGTIGLLVAMFLRVSAVEVHVMGVSDASLALARALGFERTWVDGGHAPDLAFDAVVDASNASHVPALALDLVEPAGRLVYVGLAGAASRIDTRTLALKDVTAVGVLSASPALDEAITALARGDIDPRPLVAATVGLDQVGAVLSGDRPAGAGPGPKIHIDPRRALDGPG